MEKQYKVDYIFGLSEMLYRVRANNLRSNSILVISYAHQYQCRSYVVAHAIDKGWYSSEIKELLDFMTSGRVVFYAKDHYVGTCQDTPRELTKEEFVEFESSRDSIIRRNAEELARYAEAASQMYQHALDDRMADLQSTDRVRADEFGLYKVDDPTR